MVRGLYRRFSATRERGFGSDRRHASGAPALPYQRYTSVPLWSTPEALGARLQWICHCTQQHSKRT